MITWALDNETFLIERERPAPPVVCVSAHCSDWLRDEGEPEVWHVKDPETLRGLRALLNDPNVRIVGHNIAYDAITWAATWPWLLPLIFKAYQAGRIVDTGIRAQLVDIAYGRTMADDRVRVYTLQDLHAYVFRGEPMPGPGKGADSWRLRYGELYNVPLEDWPEDAIAYSKADVVSPLAICLEQDKVAKYLANDADLAYRAFCLTLTSARGMRCDGEQIDKLELELNAELDELRPELEATGLLVWEKAKNKLVKKKKPAQEMIARAFLEAGLPPMLTETGEKRAEKSGYVIQLHDHSLDKAACFLVDHTLLLKRAKYVASEKILTTYVPFLRAGVDGPITTRYGMVATSRTGASTPSPPAVGGAFQTMPKRDGIRQCIVPREGYLFLAGDFTGAELHKQAQECKRLVGFSVLGDVLNAGRNVHLYMGAEMIGLDYDEAMVRYKQGDPDVAYARFMAKAANFGFMGAMGARKFIIVQLKEGVRWTLPEAQKLRRSWLRTFPEMQKYFDVCKAMLDEHGTARVQYPDSGMYRTVRGLSMCANGWFQVGCATGAMWATNEVTRRCYVEPESTLYGLRPVVFVHDELILEVKDDPAIYQPAAVEFGKTMTDEFNRVVPDYPTEAVPVLMREWSKGAEPAFDKKGGLIPWQA